MQGCTSNGHCNMCLVVAKAWPHSHVLSTFKYFHLLRCFLMHATPMHNLLRHLHVVQGLVFPFAKLSSRLTAQLCDSKFYPVLPFTATYDFCREVSRSYGANEAFSLQSSLCLTLAVSIVVCICFLLRLFHPSTYISSDVM